MIVKLTRPEDGEGPWLLHTDPSAPVIIDFIEPTPEMREAMVGQDGHFEAEREGEGWNIIRRVDDQGW